MPTLRNNTLIVVLGPTASGKTALAIELAKELGGEVISADSMQVYRGMNIGTAKPTEEEQMGIPHHLLDILEPGERFSVAEYAIRAREMILSVQQRGKTPILCGGTGLYIQAVVDNIQYDESALNDSILREELRDMATREGNEAVWKMLHEIDPETAASLHPNNLGRVIRAIEVYRTTGKSIREQERESKRFPSPFCTCQIGLRCHDRERLYERINERVDIMMRQGLLEEAKMLYQKGLCGTSGQAIGYKELSAYFAGSCTLEEAVALLKMETRRYAKRQLTWFGRDSRIFWIEPDCLPTGVTAKSLALDKILKDCGGAP